MHDDGSLLRSLAAVVLIGVAAAAGLTAGEARAQSMDRVILAEEVRKEVQRQLSQEGVLDQAIQRGIEDYIRKQRAAARAQEQTSQSAKARNMRPVSAERDHIYGDPEAPVSLVEYSDFECPFCKRFHPAAKALVDRNPGKVNWVYRHFPLNFHNPGAQKQAEASECAAEQGGNESFWTYTDTIYERTTSNGKGFPIDRLVPLAEELGLDRAAFEECLDSGKMQARVAEDYEDGVAAGVTGTPGNIIVNNTTGAVAVQAGAVPLDRLQVAVNRVLEAKQGQ